MLWELPHFQLEKTHVGHTAQRVKRQALNTTQKLNFQQETMDENMHLRISCFPFDSKALPACLLLGTYINLRSTHNKTFFYLRCRERKEYQQNVSYWRQKEKTQSCLAQSSQVSFLLFLVSLQNKKGEFRKISKAAAHACTLHFLSHWRTKREQKCAEKRQKAKKKQHRVFLFLFPQVNYKEASPIQISLKESTVK